MDSKIFAQSILNGMIPIIKIIILNIMPIVIGYIGIIVIKKIVKLFSYDFHIISGDSKRVANKKAKRAEGIVDIISSVKDINDLRNK